MFYGILTELGKNGMPFQYHNTAPQAPGDPLRVSEHATLIGLRRITI